jgi:outer membrane protein, heavy metal efflux system
MNPPLAVLAAISMRLRLSACVCAALVGCASYQPLPIDPQTEAAAFESRSLAPGPWRLSALENEAVHLHPDVAAATARLKAAEAAAISAGARPNPTFLASAQQNTSAEPGAKAWTDALGLDIPIEVAGKQDLRATRAAWLLRAAEQSQIEALWRIRSRAREAYLAAYPLDGPALGRLSIQEELARETDRRLAAGMVSSGEALQARMAARQARLSAEDVTHRRDEGRRRLAAAIGVPFHSLNGAVLPFDDLRADALPSLDEIHQAYANALQTRPDLLAMLAQYEATQTALQLEIARQYPDIAIGPGYTWDAGALKWSLGLAISLPLFDRNQGPIAEAQARRAEAAAAFRGLQEQAISEMGEAQAAYAQAIMLFKLTDDMAVDQRTRLRSAELSFQAGAIDRMALLSARLEASAAESIRTEALLDAFKSAGRVEDALHHPIPLAPTATKGQP